MRIINAGVHDFGDGRTCLNPSHCVPLCVFNSYVSSYATSSAKVLISCLKLSLANAGTSGWLSGRLDQRVSARYSSTSSLLRLLQWYHVPALNLACSRGLDSRRGEEVQSADLTTWSALQVGVSLNSVLTLSFSPHTHAVCTPGGAYDGWGTSFR